jgi:hypothetical protein
MADTEAEIEELREEIEALTPRTAVALDGVAATPEDFTLLPGHYRVWLGGYRRDATVTLCAVAKDGSLTPVFGDGAPGDGSDTMQPPWLEGRYRLVVEPGRPATLPLAVALRITPA